MIVMGINFVSGAEFDFESPGEIAINEEFNVRIISEENETFDIKIFVHKGNPSNRSEVISETYNLDRWKSSWYYVIESFPEQETYKIRALEEVENGEICVQLRIPGASNYDRNCKGIKVSEDLPVNNISQEPNEPKKADEKNETERESFVFNKIDNNENYLERRVINEKIILNPLPSGNEDKEEFLTKKGKLRLGVVYSFIFLSVIIIILLALRRI